jgi:hypothetical protein
VGPPGPPFCDWNLDEQLVAMDRPRTVCWPAAPPPATAPPPSPQPVIDADRPFLNQIHSSTATRNPDVDLVALADRACGTLNATQSLSDTLSSLHTVTGWSDDDTAAFVGASIRACCPQLASLAGVG